MQSTRRTNPALHGPLPVWRALLLVLVAATAQACTDDGSSSCQVNGDCNGSQVCAEGRCTTLGARSDTGGPPNAPADGPTTACAYPSTSATATLEEGLGGNIESARTTFYGEGALESVDSIACDVLDNPPDPLRFNPENMGCGQGYLCGDCRFWVMERGPDDWILGGDSEDVCPEYAGFYNLEREAATCSPVCSPTEYCDNGVCRCPSGCMENTVCCGGSLCGGGRLRRNAVLSVSGRRL